MDGRGVVKDMFMGDVTVVAMGNDNEAVDIQYANASRSDLSTDSNDFAHAESVYLAASPWSLHNLHNLNNNDNKEEASLPYPPLHWLKIHQVSVTDRMAVRRMRLQSSA